MSGETILHTATDNPPERQCPGSADNKIGELQAGACVEWRYITHDNQWALVKDRNRNDALSSWAFIDRRAIAPKEGLANMNNDHPLVDTLTGMVTQYPKFPQYPHGVCTPSGT
jgi:hypothetical protein